jgi:hypothetical protein
MRVSSGQLPVYDSQVRAAANGGGGQFFSGSSEMDMNFVMVGPPLISLLAGISILIWPRLLNYIVAFYLILFGLVGLLPLMM